MRQIGPGHCHRYSPVALARNPGFILAHLVPLRLAPAQLGRSLYDCPALFLLFPSAHWGRGRFSSTASSLPPPSLCSDMTNEVHPPHAPTVLRDLTPSLVQSHHPPVLPMFPSSYPLRPPDSLVGYSPIHGFLI